VYTYLHILGTCNSYRLSTHIAVDTHNHDDDDDDDDDERKGDDGGCQQQCALIVYMNCKFPECVGRCT
jgi:hypothetical protein